jgi:tetratricopeptide (TPR) repeat protein
LALLRLDIGKLEQATADLSALHRDQPKNALVQYNLAVALRQGRQPDRAVKLLLMAKSALEDTPGVALALASAYLDLEEKKLAREVLEELVRKEPHSAQAFDLLGLVSASEGDYEAARANHVRALGLEPYRQESHFNLGLALTALGRLPEAEQAFATCLYLDPQDAEAAFNLGVTSEAMGNAAQAVTSYRTALTLDPEMKQATQRLQRLLGQEP